MRASGALVLLASGLQLAAAAFKPTEFFELRTVLRPGQPNKKAFDKLYTAVTGLITFYPVFSQLNSDATIFGALESAPANGSTPALYSIFYNETSTTGHNFLEMQFNVGIFSGWQPTAFIPTTRNTTPQFQNRFYFNTTAGVTKLFWEDGDIGEQNGSWKYWVACDWSYGLKQLFFTEFFNTKFPSFCAAIDLQVFPVADS